jgi:hypothetical protein
MTSFTLVLSVCGNNTLETKRNKTRRMTKDKKRNPVAQELRTPKYKSRVVQDKRKKQEKHMTIKDVMEQARKFLSE